MADQKKWFKVWNSILTDPSFLDLPVEQIGRWTLLGALISLHGENGKITLSKESLYRLLRIQNDNGMVLPNVEFMRGENDNGTITVSMKNWAKYQLDSTGYERLKRFRKAHNDNGAREEKTKIREDKEEEKKKKRIFIPPSLEEVSKYCTERRNTVNPQKWMSHYESNGWMVGKNKMKDWKAAVRTWEDGTGKPLPYKPPEEIWGKCPKCGKETSKEDITRLGSCLVCYKPASLETIKGMLKQITKSET